VIDLHTLPVDRLQVALERSLHDAGVQQVNGVGPRLIDLKSEIPVLGVMFVDGLRRYFGSRA
jgi:hypothetical protein